MHVTDRVGVSVGAEGDREKDAGGVTVCVAENVSESELADTAAGAARMQSATRIHDQTFERVRRGAYGGDAAGMLTHKQRAQLANAVNTVRVTVTDGWRCPFHSA